MTARLAIPNRGRLLAGSHRALELCSILHGRQAADRRLFWRGKDEALDVFALRSTDIPRRLLDNTVQFGITGRDYVVEAGGADLPELVDLRLAHGWLCVLAPEGGQLDAREGLNGKRIATKYVSILTSFMAVHEIVPGEIVPVEGAAEIYCRLGLADFIFDIVCTGRTARANHVRPVARIFETSAHLYASLETPSTFAGMTEELTSALGGVAGSIEDVEEYPWETIDIVLPWR